MSCFSISNTCAKVVLSSARAKGEGGGHSVQSCWPFAIQPVYLRSWKSGYEVLLFLCTFLDLTGADPYDTWRFQKGLIWIRLTWEVDTAAILWNCNWKVITLLKRIWRFANDVRALNSSFSEMETKFVKCFGGALVIGTIVPSKISSIPYQNQNASPSASQTLYSEISSVTKRSTTLKNMLAFGLCPSLTTRLIVPTFVVISLFASHMLLWLSSEWIVC